MRHRIKISTFKTKSCHLHRGSAYFYKVKGFLHSASIPLLGGAALLLGVMMILPVTQMQPEAYAATEQDYGYDRKISLSIYNNGEEVVENGTVSTEVKAGEVSYLDNTLRINTSKIANYYVGIQAAADGSSNLVGVAHGGAIAGVGENVAPENFGDNTWGYALTDQVATPSTSLTYSTLPAHADTSPLQYQASNPADGHHDLKLTFAAKINADRPSDHYQAKVMVSVAADPKTLFDGIYYMQEMTPSICAKAQENDTMQLVDRRDDKSYWVAKLKDGNCWMTQNLDLDISASGLKAIDTDIATDWAPQAAEVTIATGNLTAETWPDENRLIRSYDPGKYVYTRGDEINDCGVGVSSLINCIGWEDYTNKRVSNNPGFITNTDSSNYYDAHYIIGNYYTYDAITAGTSLDIVPESNTTINNINKNDASGSICPKGWQLPLSGKITSSSSEGELNMPISRNKSFARLLESYGWNNWIVPSSGDSYVDSIVTSLNGSTINISSFPLFFLRGGNIYDYSINYVGNAYYWSATSYNSGSAYSLVIYGTIRPVNIYGKDLGRTIRCVAK